MGKVRNHQVEGGQQMGLDMNQMRVVRHVVGVVQAVTGVFEPGQFPEMATV